MEENTPVKAVATFIGFLFGLLIGISIEALILKGILSLFSIQLTFFQSFAIIFLLNSITSALKSLTSDS
jgi:hypothetical protein